MKTKIIFLSIFFYAAATVGQTQWTKYANNPVMVKQNLFTETYAIGQPTVIMENDTFKMWYVAGGLPYITSRLFYAWSTDGITWNKYNAGAAIMEPGSAGQWDRWMDTPEIIHDISGYKVYYFGDSLPGGSGSKPSPIAGIGVATSLDGINWTKYSGNPILTHGDDSSWDRSWIESPAVLFDSTSGNYLMWYSGVDTTTWKIQIGLATSTDGFSWTKYSGNPVISSGSSGSYDDMWVSVPAVIKRGNEYEMWYSAFSSVSGYDTLRIAYATSIDGINWTKYEGNPLFSTTTPPYVAQTDNAGPWAPDVVYDANTNSYKMWYETQAGFCFATSTSTVDVKKIIQNDPNKVLIYPNPCTNVITVETRTGQIANADIKITDRLGRSVFSEMIESTEQKLYLNLPSGIYFYFIKNKKETIGTGKIIVQ